MRTFRVATYFAMVILGLTGRQGWGADQKKVPPSKLPQILEVRPVPPPPILSLTLPGNVVGGGSGSAQVVLSNVVAGTNALIQLQSTNAEIASVPATVTIPIGSSSANFTIQTRPVSSSTPVSITAQSGVSTKTAALKVDPISLQRLSSTDVTVIGGKTISFEVRLNGAAPPGGAVVMLSTWQLNMPPLAVIPGFVKVPEGALSASFPAVIPPVNNPNQGEVRGSYGGVSQKWPLEVITPDVVSILLTPNTATGGSSVTGQLTLSGPAPSAGWVIYLKSDQTGVALTDKLTIPSGVSQGTFNVTTTPVSQIVHAKISGTSYYYAITATLTINPPVLKGIALNPASVSYQAGTVDGSITLSGPAPAGVSVPLSWSNADGATAPPTVSVAQGATTANFKVTLRPVTAPTPFTLFAYYGGARMSATVQVNP